MATPREIKRRIGSIKNTQKITSAMEMVASVKMRKARNQMLSARPYAEKLLEIAAHLAQSMCAGMSPLSASRPIKKLNLIVVTADKGMCGGFNANVSRKAIEFIKGNSSTDIDLTMVGKKGNDFFKRRPATSIIDKYTDVFLRPNYADAAKVGEKAIADFLGGAVDEVWVVYNQLVGVASAKTVVQRLLPVEQPEVVNVKGSKPEYIIESDEGALVDAILRQSFLNQIWRIFLESYAAEQAARMAAMHGATKNAGELITKLTLFYNKARQAAITKELLEVISGADALK